MNRERARELLPIIQVFAEGKPIQYRGDSSEVWKDVESPSWSAGCTYRIKPEPKLRPLNAEEMIALVGKRIRNKNTGNVYLVDGFIQSQVAVTFGPHETWCYANGLLGNYVHAEKDNDGQPIGIEVTE